MKKFFVLLALLFTSLSFGFSARVGTVVKSSEKIDCDDFAMLMMVKYEEDNGCIDDADEYNSGYSFYKGWCEKHT